MKFALQVDRIIFRMSRRIAHSAGDAADKDCAGEQPRRGMMVGAKLGAAVGANVGELEGTLVGPAVGLALGKAVGSNVGRALGTAVGLCVTSENSAEIVGNVSPAAGT